MRVLKLLQSKEKGLNPLDSHQNHTLEKSVPSFQNLSLLARKLWLLNKKFLNEENGITAEFLFRAIIDTHTESFQLAFFFFFLSQQSCISANAFLSSTNYSTLNSYGVYRVQAPLSPILSKALLGRYWTSSLFSAGSKYEAILPLTEKPLTQHVVVNGHLQTQ